MKKKAYGKINLGLKVVSKRSDGYHNLEMIMAKIALYDEMEFLLSEKVEVICEGVQQEENLVYKVANYLKEKHNINEGAKIVIKKNIPSEAGLGGGSSDAACAINSLCEIWNIKLDNEEKKEIALKFGSDIPFFVENRFAYATGRGEKLVEIAFKEKINILIVKPVEGVSTREVFSKVVVNNDENKILEVVELFEQGEKQKAIQLLENDLEVYADFILNGKIQQIKNKMREYNAYKSIMSGSGSSVIGFFENDEDLRRAKEFFIRKGFFVCETSTMGDSFE